VSQNQVAQIDQPLHTHEYVPTVAMSPQQTVQLVKQLEEMKRSALRNNVDYMLIPGTPQPSLLKPGAERLLQCFGLGHRITCVKANEDWEGRFFYYQYKATIVKSYPTHEIIVAECEGSANSREGRYHDRWLTEKKARDAGVDLATCPSRLKEGRYGSYQEYKVENPNPYSLVNTLQKMAQKRALVGATLQATGSSGLFTQDLDDMGVSPVHPSVKEDRQPFYESSLKPTPRANGMMNDQQRRTLFKIGKSKGLSNEEIKKTIYSLTKKGSVTQVTFEEAGRLMMEFQKLAKEELLSIANTYEVNPSNEERNRNKQPISEEEIYQVLGLEGDQT
jgi:hypothetical protein